MKLKLQILLLLVVNVCYAQMSQNDFKNITIKDGLSQSSVYSIYQDEKGFMWFGSFDGLNRYDGHSMKVYLPHAKSDGVESLSHGYIKGLDGDKRGKIFIATYGGGLNVLELSTNKISCYSKSDSLSILDDHLSAIKYVDDTTVWIAASKGVARFNPQTKTFRNYNLNNSLYGFSAINVLSLYLDNNRDLWLGTYGSGLLKLNQNDGSCTRFYNESSDAGYFDENVIRSIVEYNDSLMLLATGSGLYLFNSNTGKSRLYNLKGKRLEKMVKDISGNLWITTSFEGLVCIDNNGEVKMYKHNPYNQKSFVDNRLFASYCDNIGNVWIGTSNSGVVRINRNRKTFAYIHHVANKPSIPEGSVFAIEEDSDGKVWIGTENGLIVWDRGDNSFVPVGIKIDGVLKYDVAVWDLKFYRDELWIATSQGLIVYNLKSKKQLYYKKDDNSSGGLPNDNIDCFGSDNDYMWVTTTIGLCRVNVQTKKFVNYATNGSSDNRSYTRVRKVYTDSKGRVWFCSVNGLRRYDPQADNFIVYNFAEKELDILSNDISSILEIENDTFLLATSKGISVFDYAKGEIVKNIGEKEGLPKGLVYRMVKSEKEVWVSTNNGLAVLNRETFNVKDRYFEEDGLQSDEFNPAAIKLSDGYFLFGGINGVSGFYPDSIRKSGYVPPLYITGLSIFGKEVTANDTLNSNKITFEKSIISASKIVFDPDEKMFSIRFSALDYSNSNRIKYYYRMLPISTEWVSLGRRNFVTFVDLNPGKYTLEVKSTNGDGVLCDNVKSITLVVQPPFWRRKWVVGIEIVLLVLVVYLILRYRTYRLLKDKRILEEVVAKRTQEIARQKDKLEQFAANLEEKVNQRTTELKIAKQNAEESDRLKSAFLSNMSHEIRTPMNAILGFSELLSSSGFDEEDRLGFAKMVRTNGDALLTLLNDIIDISMIESGQLKLNIVDVNIYNLVNNVYLVFKRSHLLSEKSGVSLDMSIKDDSDVFIKTDSQRLLQILNNLVGNALKFTDRGFVEIGYRLKDREVLFFVKDTGIGISEEGLNKIFDRFHKLTGDSKSIYGGNGLGLTITKNLVEALNGKIWVESTEGVGTAFYFSLPM